jgi:hypothetical protein
MLTIKNYIGNPMTESDFFLFERCTIYDVEEKKLVYEFRIRDKNCIPLCSIYLAREANPEGKYGMWGIINSYVYRTTETRYIDKVLIKNWNWVATDMNAIIQDISKMKWI